MRSAARQALFGIDEGSPMTIGRYRIDRRIGSGGMGEVYQGVDPELDRTVAVKLVHPHLGGARGPLRLRREARALARLSHPNVVQVYEVGEHEGQTFLAMEFVEGGTLTQWLRAERRRWSAILACFVAAGRGLAAAHAAEITHRDFKPDNVLMTAEGRVRVADFGLAYTDEPIAPMPEDSVADTVPSSERLSVAGSVLGTVRYMPLEQLRGEEVDARADQFAFCVALYESLWGQPPFAITSVIDRLEALERQAVVLPPRAGVPRRLWRVIRRGLARDPAQRWPDMESLLAALESVPRRRRQLAVAAVVAPLAGLLVVLGRASDDAERAPADPCLEVSHALDSSWSDERREALRGAFEATALTYAGPSAAAVQEGLDTWSRDWLEQREQLCRATVGAQLPDEVLGLRGACLERQREHFEATTEVLLDADARAVTRAREQVAHLPTLGECSDDEHLLLGVQPPPPDQAATTAEIRQQLARSQAERLAGHPKKAERLVGSALEAAERLGYRPVLAEALAEAGEVAIDLDDPPRGIEQLERAVDLAEATRHDRLAARVWLDLARQTAREAHNEQRGRDQLRRAESASERVGIDPLSRSRLEFVRAKLAELAGDTAQAESALRAALAQLDGLDDARAPLVRPGYLSHLAQLVTDDERALSLYREALHAAELGFGEGHPVIATHAFALGQALQAAGHSDEAVAPLERAADLWLRGPDTPDPELGVAFLSLSQLALGRGGLDEAERHARRAQEIFARSLPEDHKRHGDASMALGVVASWRGDSEAALQAYEQAAARYERSLGARALILADVHANAGIALLELERLAPARERFQRALLSGRSGSPAMIARFGLTSIALHDGDPQAAREQLDALALLREHFDDDARAEYEFLDALTSLRRTTSARPLGDDLLAAFRDPTDEHHDYLRWLVSLTQMTSAEERRLGITNP